MVSSFFSAIAVYNERTEVYRVVLLVLLLVSMSVSGRRHLGLVCKVCLAVIYFFLSFVFLGVYGVGGYLRYVCLGVFVGIGLLLLYDAWQSRGDELQPPTIWQWILFDLYLLYPLVSWLCGHVYPQVVTYIMPGSVVTATIALYASYPRRPVLLMVLLALCGAMGGVSAFFLGMYEDLIALLAAIAAVLMLLPFHRSH